LKKTLFLILAVILATGMIGGVFAYFTDVETSNGNVFTAGTLDLKIADFDEHPEQDGVHATWSMDNMVPGASFCGPNHISLINSGTVQGNHVEISFSHEIEDQPDVESDTNWDSTPGEMARWLQIYDMFYSCGTSIYFVGLLASGHKLVDANHNGFIDLEDVTMPENAAALDNLPPPPLGGQTSFSMTLFLNSGATNDIQGDTLITTVTFTLNQSATQ
jgi:spore coat-associated protein N